MWFVSELPCKKEVKCQVVYFYMIFLSHSNTEVHFIRPVFNNISGIYLPDTTLIPQTTSSGRGRVKHFDNGVKAK